MTNLPHASVQQIKQIECVCSKSESEMINQSGKTIFEFIDQKICPSKEKLITCLCGKGNNAADPIAAAIQLKSIQYSVVIILSYSQHHLKPITSSLLEKAHQLTIPIYSNLPMEEIRSLLKQSSLVIDGLIGINLKGNPHKPIADIIRAANESKTPILAVDLPSGLTPDKGKPTNPTIKATYTLTFGLPKKGLFKPSAQKFVGKLWLGDSGFDSKSIQNQFPQYQSPFYSSSFVMLNT